LNNKRRKYNLKVLLAEPNRADARALSHIITTSGHNALIAPDGFKALEIYFSEKIDLVILSTNLPGVSEYDVSDSIQTDIKKVPVIFTSSNYNERILKDIYESGADDFFVKPYLTSIIEIKLRGFAKKINMRSMLETQRDVIAQSNRMFALEQKAAKRIFDKISEHTDKKHPDLKYSLKALSIFNGDIILSANSPSGQLYVFLGDFTGHGLVASLSSMPLIQIFYRMVKKGFSLDFIIAEINSRLFETLPIDIFCCACVAMLDSRKEEIQIWNGGMPKSYLFSKEVTKYKTIESKHVPLGVLSSKDFSMNIEIYPMEIGAKLFMCSDGIIEAPNKTGEMFGEERLIEVFEKSNDIKSIFINTLEEIELFTEGAMSSDDVSLVEVNMSPYKKIHSPKSTPVSRESDKEGILSGNLHYTITSSMMNANNPIPALLQILFEIPGFKSVKSELFTVLSELYANALDHGILNLDSSLKKSAEGFAKFYTLKQKKLSQLKDESIHFQFDYACHKSKGEIAIIITDSGAGFDHVEWAGNSQSNGHLSGRGLSLIHQISDKMIIHDKGNKVEVSLTW
jgi:two-component system, HptB-dependent secretion and biofilm response regulator